MQKTFLLLTGLLLLTGMLAIGACSTSRPDQGMTTTFVIVRHAEKADDTRDPALSNAGKARAQALARLLADTHLTAAYATAYQRTQQTAQPAAESHLIGVTTYDAQMPASTFASMLRAQPQPGTVLVVGHSNTVPEIASALSGKPTEAIPDNEFGRLYRISIDPAGNATLDVVRY